MQSEEEVILQPQAMDHKPLIDDAQWQTLVLDEIDRQSSEMDSYIARFQEQLNLRDDEKSEQAHHTLSVRRDVRASIEGVLHGYMKQLSPAQAHLMDWAQRAYSFEVRPTSGMCPPPTCVLTGDTEGLVAIVFRAQVADTHSREISDVFYVSNYAKQAVNAWNILARFEAFLHQIVSVKQTNTDAEQSLRASNHEALLRTNVNEGAYFLHVFFDYYLRRKHGCYIAI
jgi:hypothetical protein